MKSDLLDIEAILSNATAHLSIPKPNVEKVRRGIEVARSKLLELAEKLETADPLHDAKFKLALVYLSMKEAQKRVSPRIVTVSRASVTRATLLTFAGVTSPGRKCVSEGC